MNHKPGVKNRAADALSCKLALLSAMSVEVIGFERLKEAYEDCLDFGEIYTALRDGPSREYPDFIMEDDYLFRERRLCVL